MEKRSTASDETVKEPANDDNDPEWYTLSLLQFDFHDFLTLAFFRLSHTLKFEDSTPILARDANTKSDDWFEISDPRNAINKRRREESKKIMKNKGMTSKTDLP